MKVRLEGDLTFDVLFEAKKRERTYNDFMKLFRNQAIALRLGVPHVMSISVPNSGTRQTWSLALCAHSTLAGSGYPDPMVSTK